MILPVLLTLLWSLVEVHSQTEFPYVSFMNETLPNHGYVDLTLVGDPERNPSAHSVQCHTDLFTCCSGGQGLHRGDWYFPNGTILPFPGRGDIVEVRGDQRVDIRRNNNANSPSGIYRCFITTEAVQDNSVRETVYVGLYATGGNNVQCIYLYSASINALLYVLGALNISGGVELTKGNSQFTLTCISTGGPATTVTWTRGSDEAEGERMTVFHTTTAATTAQYTHTLTVTGTLGGVYTCTVANKPSSDSAMLNLGIYMCFHCVCVRMRLFTQTPNLPLM